MPVNNVPTKAEVEHGDPLTERIRESIIGVENLRAENRRSSGPIRRSIGSGGKTPALSCRISRCRPFSRRQKRS